VGSAVALFIALASNEHFNCWVERSNPYVISLSALAGWMGSNALIFLPCTGCRCSTWLLAVVFGGSSNRLVLQTRLK
jgi:hypothetical protein